jgi:hypothetical protein
MSFFVLRKIRFLALNCPEVAEKAWNRGIEKNALRFFNG